MLQHDDNLWEALRSHQTGVTRGITSYQGTQLPVRLDSVGQLVFQGSAEIQGAVSGLRASGHGSSLVPKSKIDPLATFGQEIALWRDVKVRGAQWSVPLGVYRLTRAARATEHKRGDVVLDWSVVLDVKDRFKQIQDDDFLAVASPVPGNTVWDEIRRLSPIPVQQALGNTTVPASTIYRSRIDAIATLCDLIGGVPHMTREGVLTARVRDAWLTVTDPVFDIFGVIEWSDEMTDEFYNQVQVTASSDPTIVAYAQLLDDANPLSVGRAGGRTFKQSSTTITTQVEAQAAADLALTRLLSGRSRQVQVTCTPEALLLELGDFGWFRDPVKDTAVLGEVSAMTIPINPTGVIEVTVIASEEA